MDYTQSSLAFRIRKALRYARLYGPRRTYYKVLAQYHMQRQYNTLPRAHQFESKNRHVGIIGCGNFAFSTIAYYLHKNFGNVIRGCMDIDENRAYSFHNFYRTHYFTTKSADIINDAEIDLVFIASNHASHAEYAIDALKAGKHVHIEKPHAVSMDQLKRLCHAAEAAKTKINLGFNRPLSPMGRLIAKYLADECGPGMYNWFIAGHAIDPSHWYFHPQEGGRVLGNLCHWTDFVYRLVSDDKRYPIIVNSTKWQKSDCDIVVNYVFGDGSVATLSFSAKGHTFEGVRERFSAQKNNVLVALDDFDFLRIDKGDEVKRLSLLFRDHGHEETVRDSYHMTDYSGESNEGCSINYIWQTGELVLRTRDSLESGKTVIINYPYDCVAAQ